MRTRRSRSWAAWVTSAFLHALVAVLIVRAGERSARRMAATAAEERVDFDIEIAGEREESAPVPESRKEPSRRSPARRERSSLGAAPSPSPRQRARGDQESAERGDQQGLERGGPATVPSSPANNRAGGAAVDLSFGALADDVKGRFAGPPPAEGVLRARPHRFDVDELRADLDRRRDAVNNVEAGRVDPLLYDYLRGARARFEDTAEKLADDLAVGPGDMVRGWGRGYLRTVDDANRGVIGARADAPREGGGDTRNEISPGTDVLGAYGEAHRQAASGAEERRAEVCLDVAAGRETGVVLHRGSGNAALDRLTIESFTKAVAARPVPPDARRGLACYELVISAYRMPPLPAISCGIGRAGLTCVWPFKKVTSVKGHLLSVEYPPADDGRAPRGPSLLRKPR
jgi:hypothetical protein